MSSSIYNIQAWAGTTAYQQDDIVLYSGLYYYAKSNHTSGASFDSTLWDGVTTYNSTTKPYFFWVPSYGSAANLKPKIKQIKYGDGYEQRVPDGISNNLLTLDLTFDLMTRNKMTAITHFLNLRGGKEAFVYLPQPPFSLNKLFVCREIPIVNNFFNNYSMKLVFDEVVN